MSRSISAELVDRLLAANTSKSKDKRWRPICHKDKAILIKASHGLKWEPIDRMAKTDKNKARKTWARHMKAHMKALRSLLEVTLVSVTREDHLLESSVFTELEKLDNLLDRHPDKVQSRKKQLEL